MMDGFEEAIKKEPIDSVGGHVIHILEEKSVCRRCKKNNNIITTCLLHVSIYSVFLRFSLIKYMYLNTYL